MKTQKLPDRWFRSGFWHQILLREGDWLIVWRTAPHHDTPHYEIVRPGVSTRRRGTDGTWIETDPYEVYPGSEAWGRHGYTTHGDDIDRAFAILARETGADPDTLRSDHLSRVLSDIGYLAANPPKQQ